MKDFKRELRKFAEMIQRDECFALGRFADGEGCIILNMDKDQGGRLDRPRETASWKHIPGNPIHENFRNRLIAALGYSAPGYFLGIPTQSGHRRAFSHFFQELRDLTRVPEEQLTFARIFHSSNYPLFKSDFLPPAFQRDIYLICNERADSSSIPSVRFRWNVAARNASIKSLALSEEIKAYIRAERVQAGIFLISTGPSAAIFTHELWKFNQKNTYVDIGSALDPIYFRDSSCGGLTRAYLRKHAKGDDLASFTWG